MEGPATAIAIRGIIGARHTVERPSMRARRIRQTVTVVMVSVLGLVACAPEPPPASEAEATPPRNPTVIDPQLQALDRARDVESQVLDGARRSIDAADAPDAEPR
jgi:hypothetical protein